MTHIWVRESRDKKSYTMFCNEKPQREQGEAVYYIGKVEDQKQYDKVSYLNGRASIYELIQLLK